MKSITGWGDAASNSRELAPGQADHVAGVVDHHHVQSEAEAEARDLVLPGVGRGRDLALDAPLAEPAGDHDPVEIAEGTVGEEPLDLLGLDPLQVDLGPVGVPAVAQRLDHRQVGVGEVDVLADEADANRAGGRLDPLDERLPGGQVQRVGRRPSSDASKPSSRQT